MKLSSLIEAESKKSFDETLWDWLATHYAPKDEFIHDLAGELNVEADELETAVYKILTSFTTQGKSKGKKVPVDEKELAMGIKVEMEHTNDKRISEKIARDHITEFPKGYYTELAKMEERLKVINK
jgi:hypothetical protein